MKNRGFMAFCGEVLLEIGRFGRNRAISADVLLKQVFFTGVEALGLGMLIAMLLGGVIIVEGYHLSRLIGHTDWIYKFLVFAMVRDLGPFIVCFITLARTGTAITTELGNMVLNQEVDALVVMGISPVAYLAAPRVLAVMLSLCVLMSYFLVSGIFGGFLVSNIFQNIPFGDFIDQILKQLELLDMAIMLIKVMLSGLFISLISCYHGLTVEKAITEVPQRNIKAVGRSVFAVCVINLLGTFTYFSYVDFIQIGDVLR